MNRDEFIDTITDMVGEILDGHYFPPHVHVMEASETVEYKTLLEEYDRLQAENDRLTNEVVVRKYDGTTFTVKGEE